VSDDSRHIWYYYSDGTIYHSFLSSKTLHREDGPAVVEKNNQDEIMKEGWYRNGIIHNDNGPAMVEKYDNKTLKVQKWYINGKNHKLDGPAVIWYNKDGTVYIERWCINGTSFEDEREYQDCVMNQLINQQLT
jgi:hypothetical protein